MFRHLLAIHDRFAARRDGVGIVERDRQGMHVRFLLRIDAAGFIEIEPDRFRVRRLEQHGGSITHDTIMRHGQLAALVVIHRNHLVRCAGETSFFQNRATREQPILETQVNRPLAHVGLPRPGADQRFHPFEFRRTGLLLRWLLRIQPDGTGQD